MRPGEAFSIYLELIRARLRELTSFRADFLAGTLAVFAQQGITMLFLWMMFQNGRTLGGWTFSEALLVFSLSMTVQSLSHLVFEGIHIIGPRHVEQGEFDRVLVRPGSALFHILAGYFQISGLFPAMMGFALVIYALHAVSKVWFPVVVVLSPFFLASGTLVVGGILLAGSSLAFPFRRVRAIRRMILGFQGTMAYPLEIFPRTFQGVLLIVLPFGWAAWGPARFVLTGDFRWGAGALVAGPLVWGVAWSIFSLLSRRYESTGT